MLDLIIKLILGVKPERNNFEKWGLVASTIVIASTYFIIFYLNFFEIIDNIIKLTGQEGYMEITVRISFLLITVRIISLSLFTKLDNMLGRFIAAYITQLASLIGTGIIISVRDIVVGISTNIELPLQIFYFILPYLVTIVAILLMNHIYNKKDFSLREYLSKTK